jgi:hypothetical protein
MRKNGQEMLDMSGMIWIVQDSKSSKVLYQYSTRLDELKNMFMRYAEIYDFSTWKSFVYNSSGIQPIELC